MSYTTRCPACGTTFRVVPDQLKISDGWVRCGHCADVFDATLYLEAWVPPAPDQVVMQDAPVDAPPPVEVPEAGVAAPPAPVHDEVGDAGPDLEADAPLPEEPGAAEFTPSVSSPDVDVDLPLQEPVGPVAETAEDFRAELARFAAQAGQVPAAGEGVEAGESGPTPEPGPRVELPLQAFTEPEADPEPLQALYAEREPVPAEEAEPSFVRQARRQAFWRSPGVRAALVTLGLLLSALLALQWMVHDRDRLAALHPGLAPWLEQVCEPLGCRIAAPRRIESVVIDSSTLVRRLGSFYAFDVVLKNTSDMAIAVPALELSLTDTRDQVIARRVFLPAELPGAPARMPARDSVSLSLRLSINDVGPLGMAGYRALVFYP